MRPIDGIRKETTLAHAHIPLPRRRVLLGAALAGIGVVYAGSAARAATAAAGGELTVDHAGTGTFVRSVGPFDVVALRDASGPFFLTRTSAFPEATPVDWDRARRVDPGAFGPEDTWELDFRCFAIRRPGGRIALVDAGVGPDGSPASAWAPVPGRLPAVLAMAGIGVNDVDMVVMTHLHEDHVGWTVTPDGRPIFPNARYVVQQREIASLTASGVIFRYVVEPLRRNGRLHEVDGQTVLIGRSAPVSAPVRRAGGRIMVIPTPGHTPGHQSVVVEGAGNQIVITGDVLVHAVQLVNPEVAYRFESDPDLARDSRRILLARARRDGALLATAHLKRPFIPAR